MCSSSGGFDLLLWEQSGLGTDTCAHHSVLWGMGSVHGFAGVRELWAGIGKAIFSKSRDSPECFLSQLYHKPPCSAVGMFFQALGSSFYLDKADAHGVIAHIWVVISHLQLFYFLKGQNRYLCVEILYIFLPFFPLMSADGSTRKSITKYSLLWWTGISSPICSLFLSAWLDKRKILPKNHVIAKFRRCGWWMLRKTESLQAGRDYTRFGGFQMFLLGFNLQLGVISPGSFMEWVNVPTGNPWAPEMGIQGPLWKVAVRCRIQWESHVERLRDNCDSMKIQITFLQASLALLNYCCYITCKLSKVIMCHALQLCFSFIFPSQTPLK